MFSWIKKIRRRNLLAKPFPGQWLGVLRNSVGFFEELNESERSRIFDDLRIIVREKIWEGCEGLTVTNEMKVVIAAQASLLLMGVEPGYYFDRVRTILVYPAAFTRTRETQVGWVVNEKAQMMLGEAWDSGSIVLSWPDVLHGAQNARDGRNLVLHEFAHHLDGLDGEMGGAPPMPSQEAQKTWNRVTELEFERLSDAARFGNATLLDPYGATSKAEFFAVATECFFERPLEMRNLHRELYEVMQVFYQQDPAARRQAGSLAR